MSEKTKDDRETCRAATCTNERRNPSDVEDAGDDSRYCSVGCMLKDEHIRAEAREAMYEDREAARERENYDRTYY